MRHFNDLHKEVQPIDFVMLNTGLCVSDALSLKQNCLLKLNGKYRIEADISKVSVKNHKIPIDNKLANMLIFTKIYKPLEMGGIIYISVVSQL